MATPGEEEIETVGGLPARSEKIEFDASEMRACGRCGRSNAPNRAECMYCGMALALGGATANLKFRPVEPWERAFNVVLLGGGFSDGSGTLPVDADILRRAAELAPPVPVIRTASAETAEMVRAKLEGSGFDAAVHSDEDLAAGRPPARLRSLKFEDVGFAVTAFNTGERREFPADSLELIVVGRLFEQREEQTLKRERKGLKETDARSISADSGVIDIYFAGSPDGFRILESGFDFSCLGADKGLIAAGNMGKLVDMLRSRAPSAAVSSDYQSKRSFLDEVWPPQARNDSRGVQRSGFEMSLAKAEITTNAEQFTRYSRLVRRTL